MSTSCPSPAAPYADDDARWQALQSRDTAADGVFYYSVRTTGVYCRPSCAARPLRKNVAFYTSPALAEAAGFRPCKRCRPDQPKLAQRQAATVALAQAKFAQGARDAEQVAQELGLRSSQLSLQFKAVTGQTLRAYLLAQFGASSTTRRQATTSPSQTMLFAIGSSEFGPIAVAVLEGAISAILFGDTREILLQDLKSRFPRFLLQEDATGLRAMLDKAAQLISQPESAAELQLAPQGTAFQKKVWDALRHIAPGKTASYAEIAQRIGAPDAARAVAKACASNPVAIAIPCHRVVRSDGGLSGYRWGVDKKRRLLESEATR